MAAAFQPSCGKPGSGQPGPVQGYRHRCLPHEQGWRPPPGQPDGQALAHGLCTWCRSGPGLDYARHFRPGNFYVLAFGLYSSTSLQQASEHLLLPLRLLSHAATVDCHVSDDEFHVDVAPTYPGSVHEKQIYFHAVLLGIWRSLSHTQLRPARLELRDIAEPRDAAVKARIRDFFGCPVIFNSARCRISLPLALATDPLPTGNASLVAEADQVIQRYLDELDQQHALHEIVHKVINKLSSGHFDRVSVARELGISASTLQRRLAAEGVSFTQLLNDTRRNLAGVYVRESQRPIKDIAYSLGFADLSNFTRAFRGWFGMTPRDFRQQAQKVRKCFHEKNPAMRGFIFFTLGLFADNAAAYSSLSAHSKLCGSNLQRTRLSRLIICGS